MLGQPGLYNKFQAKPMSSSKPVSKIKSEAVTKVAPLCPNHYSPEEVKGLFFSPRKGLADHDV